MYVKITQITINDEKSISNNISSDIALIEAVAAPLTEIFFLSSKPIFYDFMIKSLETFYKGFSFVRL